MSITASLFSGISGITSNGSALSVSGDNIANINTIAFKSGSALFESNLTQRIGNVEVGLGSRLAATSSNFTQGAFSASSRNTDLAIDGNGFFAVENSSGERFYTRAGSFIKNEAGELVTSVGGLNLLANEVNPSNGLIAGTPSAVNLNNIDSSPEPSRIIKMSGNLDPNATTLNGADFDGASFSAAQTSSNFSVPSTLYDSLGNAREVITYFVKVAPNQWEHYTLARMRDLDPDGGSANGFDPADPGADATVVIGSGRVTFDTNGQNPAVTHNLHNAAGEMNHANHQIWNDENQNGTLDSTTISPGQFLNTASQVSWLGASPLTFTDFQIELGQTAGSGAVMTQVANGNDSVVTRVTTDGRGTGQLQSTEFTRDGFIRGIFSNGDSRNLYQIPLALFQNNEGLSRVGSNLYQATAASGDALLNAAGGGGRGDVVSFTTEQSNVDLASEFVKIIQFQRGFQASSRTISAASDLLAELVNLGR